MFTKAISSVNAPKAIGPYSPAIKLGDFVYLSGMIPASPETNDIVGDDITQQTHQVMKNIEALLAEMNLEMRHVVKTTVYMTDLSEFTQMNDVYALYFNQPYPARSCVEVKALPKGCKVEIECLVIDTLNYEAQMNQSCGGSCCGDSDCGDGCCSDGDCGDGCCSDDDDNCGCGCGE